ncbi:MAG: DUF4253 domain-containing protein [Pseudarcicella sp.]|nr:DUF4253 domain-containing protein [Pseudarcicella sp.]MBP6409931.1 DUF4253 domain-containing protein [Pseudarcicella sp.]
MTTKAILLSTIILFSLISCNLKDSFKQEETLLLKKLDFDSELISELKEFKKGEIKQLPAIDQETGDCLINDFFNGIYFETVEKNADVFLLNMKPKFKEKGYLIFLFRSDDNKANIAVIKGHDELDILRYRRTDAMNYNLESKDIVKKVSEWKAKYGVTIIGCGINWLHIIFDKLPRDMDAFSKDVYSFCPDSVDQGTGSIEELKKAIIEMNGVWLWWD